MLCVPPAPLPTPPTHQNMSFTRRRVSFTLCPPCHDSEHTRSQEFHVELNGLESGCCLVCLSFLHPSQDENLVPEPWLYWIIAHCFLPNLPLHLATHLLEVFTWDFQMSTLPLLLTFLQDCLISKLYLPPLWPKDFRLSMTTMLTISWGIKISVFLWVQNKISLNSYSELLFI